MRITRELLIKNAEDTVKTRSDADKNIVAAFLHGSLVFDDPLLGGTTDIDLTFVYERGEERREFVRLTDEIHLDIYHQPKEKFEDGRGMRVMAWQGSTIFNCLIMYDPKHFLDFTQANVRGIFDRPETVLKRAQPWLESARRTWLRLNSHNVQTDVSTMREYLKALEQTVNAVASLSGPPLTERRLMLDFPKRAQALGQAGLQVGLTGLLGGKNLEVDTIRRWLPEWELAYDAATEMMTRDVRLHPFRKPYYLRAMTEMLAGENPQAALWPLLNTWTDAINVLGGSGRNQTAWTNAYDELNLLGDHFASKLAGLDAYLDTVEALFEEWRTERGL